MEIKLKAKLMAPIFNFQNVLPANFHIHINCAHAQL